APSTTRYWGRKRTHISSPRPTSRMTPSITRMLRRSPSRSRAPPHQPGAVRSTCPASAPIPSPPLGDASRACAVDPEFRPALPFPARHRQEQAPRGRVEETGPGQLARGELRGRLVAVRIDLPDDRQEALPTRGVEALALGVVEEVIDVPRDGHGGDLLAGVE